MAETGRIIAKRYLLQRVIKQGQHCVIYEGIDQVLHRPVAVKIVPAIHIQSYRAAIRATASFSHPNIIGTYDLVMEAEALYIVQEYVEGEDFSVLLQRQLSPYEVADLGVQICQALLYAGSPARHICHGDLTPTAVIRDPQGLVRVNNFALPCDLYYFMGWSVVGGEGAAASDRELPWGQQTEGRRADDTRAVGLLLYQLLTPRMPGAATVEPPANGQLRFLRTAPPELCELIARAIVRQHPEHINTPEVLYTQLKILVEMLEPPVTVPPVDDASSAEDVLRPNQFPVSGLPSTRGTANLVQALSVRETATAAASLPHSPELALTAMEHSPATPTVADVSLKLAAARQAAYPSTEPARRRLSFPVLLVIGLVLFALFFIVGYFLATMVMHP